MTAGSGRTSSSRPGRNPRGELLRENKRIVQQQVAQASEGPQTLSESMPREIAAGYRFSIAGLTENSARLLAAAKLPERHLRKFKSEAGEQWSRARKSVCDQIGGGFTVALLGGRGTGKTQIGVHAAIGACCVGRSALYAKAMDFFLDVRATYKSEEASEADAIAKFVNPMLLVMDELQVRGDTDFEDRMLTYMLDKRYDAMRDTILIANLSAEAFEDAMGYSVSDRMVESGGVIECNWGSFRGAQ